VQKCLSCLGARQEARNKDQKNQEEDQKKYRRICQKFNYNCRIWEHICQICLNPTVGGTERVEGAGVRAGEGVVEEPVDPEERQGREVHGHLAGHRALPSSSCGVFPRNFFFSGAGVQQLLRTIAKFEILVF